MVGRSVRIRWGLVALLALGPLAGGTSGGDGLPAPGDSCSDPGSKVCGQYDEKSAVLVCSLAPDDAAMYVLAGECESGCENGACIKPDGMGNADLKPEIWPDELPDWGGYDVNGDFFPFDGEGCLSYQQTCKSDTECCSPGLCITGPDGYVCTKNCVDDCGPGWVCTQTGVVPDIMFICVATLDNLCKKKCFANTDCNVVGDLCLPIGAGGVEMCSRSCINQACPPEYDCKEMTDAKGDPTKQCVPQSGACECLGKLKDDYQSDPQNCGECGKVCSYPNAVALCKLGQCEMGDCLAGYTDLDKEEPGCEYVCEAGETVEDKPDMEGIALN